MSRLVIDSSEIIHAIISPIIRFCKEDGSKYTEITCWNNLGYLVALFILPDFLIKTREQHTMNVLIANVF